MPSLPVLTLPGTFTLIVQEANTADPTTTWRNTYDIQQSSGVPQPNDAIIAGIKAFARANLRSDAFLQKLTLRNWSQGPQPFANRPFLWEEFPAPAEPGLKPSAVPDGYGFQAAQSTGGEVVLFCKRIAGPGFKSSNMFLRGLLDTADVVSETGGKWVLVTGGGATVTAARFSSIVTAHLGAFLNPGATLPQLVLVHVGNHHAGPAVASPQVGLVLVAASTNKQTRKNKK